MTAGPVTGPKVDRASHEAGLNWVEPRTRPPRPNERGGFCLLRIGGRMAAQAQVEVPYQETVLYRIRHSAAHIMAQAVLEIFPEGKISIGPPVEDGFYYDFDLPRSLTPEDLEKIEERMKAIIKGDFPFIRREVSAQEARDLFKGQP